MSDRAGDRAGDWATRVLLVLTAAPFLALVVSFGLGTTRRLVSLLLDANPVVGVAAVVWLGTPLLLVAAVAALRRTPWPLVATATLHVTALAVLGARYGHLLPWPAWAYGAATAAVAVAVAALAAVRTPSTAAGSRG